MDLKETIETIRAEEASLSKLFGGDGEGVRSRTQSPEYVTKLSEAAEFLADVVEGRKPSHYLREALTTSDFPLLFADILDRQLLANYRETAATYRNYCKIGTVPDFRSVKRFAVDGSEGVLAAVPEQAEYPESDIDEAEYTYSVAKYGRRIAFSWESMINDDLGALTDIPARYARAARRSEEKFATELFVDTNGPHASFYTDANNNRVHTGDGASSDNPALTIDALQEAFLVLSKQTDADGEPIEIQAVELVVPPALEVTAMNVLNAVELRLNESGGGTNSQLVATNWMKGRVRLSVNYYIPIVAATANGDSSWFMFANPNESRPALEVGFLRGHTEPEIFVKEPNQRRVGGGSADPMGGDFLNDSIEYKIRHVYGGTRIDPKATVASNGSGA